ncbi:MAG: major facilitator superfamily 1 [Bacilli bacterium]|nr:major facilitator superfamily 1 [Bacilli bacterium]
MKATTRIYIDAFLQNIKNVAFFMFLPVLVAKLGANPLQISLSNSLPALCCAVSLAFITRQLPLTHSIYYKSGVLRQFAFLCMAVSPLLPHPIFWLLFFWTFNAVFVMITSVQQPALIRQSIDDQFLPTLFSRTKTIGIIVTIIGSLAIGKFLDAFSSHFPYNYIISMVVGALATFTGMNIIAQLAPKEKKPIHFHLVRPLRTFPKMLIAITLANAGIAVMNPIWTIYHVNILQLGNLQIGLFGMAAGVASTLLMPLMRKGLEQFGPKKVIVLCCAVLAVIPLFYSFFSSYTAILVCQTVLGAAFSYYDVAQQTLAVTEAKLFDDQLAFFSDYQLVQNLGNGLAPLLAAFIIAHLTIHPVFLTVSVLKIASIFLIISLFRPASLQKTRPVELTG